MAEQAIDPKRSPADKWAADDAKVRAEERELMMDLVDWCREFFTDPEGQWAQRAADVLAKRIGYSDDERQKREAEYEVPEP